jgi:hypothetical protein
MATAIRRRDDRRIGIQAYALLAAGVFDKADPPEKEFSFGLERILDGLEALGLAGELVREFDE